MNPPHPPALFINARALRASLLVVLKHVDDLTDIIEGRADSSDDPQRRTPPPLPELRVDRPMLAVIWRGRTCYLGYTLPFRLIERLARSPRQYVRATQLVEELWDGPRAASTVRSAVSDLRAVALGARCRLCCGSTRRAFSREAPAGNLSCLPEVESSDWCCT